MTQSITANQSLLGKHELEAETSCCHITNLLCEDLIGKIAWQCWSYNDIAGIEALACANRHFYTNITRMVKDIYLKQLSPQLTIVNAEEAIACGFPAEPTPFLPMLKLVKAFQEIAPHVENSEGVTYFNFTLPKDLTLKQIVEIAKGQGMEVVDKWGEIFKNIEGLAPEEEFPGMLTDNIFNDSRNEKNEFFNDAREFYNMWQDEYSKVFDEQDDCVRKYRCEMPAVQHCIMHTILTQKIAKRCLFERARTTFGRCANLILSQAVAVGLPSPDCIQINNCAYIEYQNPGSIGVGGWRKF